MTDVDRALKYSEDFDSDKVEYNELDALRVLAAEVRRLRAAVEAVRALGRYDCKDEYMALSPDGDWIDRDDVLAALEGER